MKVETLFITNLEDVSVEFLISKLRIKSSNYLRINSEQLDKVHFEITPNEKYLAHIDGDSTYELDTVRTVLFKRTPSKFRDDRNDPNTPYLNNERKHFLEGLYLSLGESAKWINPMFSTHIAERKLFQLKIAKKIGLKTPKSIITNSPETATEFLLGNEESIIKPISNGLQVLGDVTYSIYTSVINKDYFKEFERRTLFQTPVFLQEKIPNKHDIRVTIVGNKVFAVSISKTDSAEVDWRKPDIVKHYTKVDLPVELVNQLLNVNRTFNLVYSAIDLIQTPNNEYVFLEVNPVGEWVWLENELGINISQALIDEILWTN